MKSPGKCQFAITPPCPSPALLYVAFSGYYAGRICDGHQKAFQERYPANFKVTFEPIKARGKVKGE